MTTKTRRAADSVRLRRLYVDCRFGQMHLITAFPPSGGFDEATSLLFLHGDDGTGADFRRCAELLGSDRSVYAPDLPGSGASDGPADRLSTAILAAAITDLFDQLRLPEVDIVGCGRGALIAFELAATRPRQVRRLVVAGTQQPAAALAQPMLLLADDATTAFREPVEPVVARIRSFLDQRP